jgi:YHS domain
LLFSLLLARNLQADTAPRRSPKEALRAFNDLIGSWSALGEPEGTRQEKQRGFWTESLHWKWQFKGEDAWLNVTVEKGKYFTKGDLRYLSDKELFQLTLITVANETLSFQGPLKDHVLTLEREDEAKNETERLILTLLHGTRFLYRYEVKPKGRSLFTRVYRVGATKEGIAFADAGSTNPECVVSGGLGTIKVRYKGETYYVCCTGCRDAFNDDPEKYIKEFQVKKAKEKAR